MQTRRSVGWLGDSTVIVVGTTDERGNETADDGDAREPAAAAPALAEPRAAVADDDDDGPGELPKKRLNWLSTATYV